MKIAEIEVGTEYRYQRGYGGWGSGLRRVRVDAIETVPETMHGYYSRGKTRNVRKLRVTELNADSGRELPSGDGGYLTGDLVLAKDVLGTWEDFREAFEQRREEDRRLEALQRLAAKVEGRTGIELVVRRERSDRVAIYASHEDAERLFTEALEDQR